ncbi:MAG: hypothetical protein HYV07_09240 [Deltaproteobacteria bacterium]|nr:hypothetical protein [Deltaproteobacteria bacterium]
MGCSTGGCPSIATTAPCSIRDRAPGANQIAVTVPVSSIVKSAAANRLKSIWPKNIRASLVLSTFGLALLLLSAFAIGQTFLLLVTERPASFVAFPAVLLAAAGGLGLLAALAGAPFPAARAAAIDPARALRD